MRISVTQMIESSPALKAASLLHSDNFDLIISGVLNIYNDLSSEEVDLIAKTNKIRQIQFSGNRVSNSTLILINEKLLPLAPYINLHVILNGNGAFNTLDFLSYLPQLKHLNVDLFRNDEIDKINQYLTLESLAIGAYSISIKKIAVHGSLRKLFIYKKPKDIEIVGKMDWLENLTFSGQTLKSLDFLLPLKQLTELRFMIGGTKTLASLPAIGRIEKLSFIAVRQLTIENLLPINEMQYLKYLFFDAQPHLTDLHWLKNKSIKTEVINCKNFQGFV